MGTARETLGLKVSYGPSEGDRALPGLFCHLQVP